MNILVSKGDHVRGHIRNRKFPLKMRLPTKKQKIFLLFEKGIIFNLYWIFFNRDVFIREARSKKGKFSSQNEINTEKPNSLAIQEVIFFIQYRIFQFHGKKISEKKISSQNEIITKKNGIFLSYARQIFFYFWIFSLQNDYKRKISSRNEITEEKKSWD